MARTSTTARIEERRLFVEKVSAALDDARAAALVGYAALKQEHPGLVDAQGDVLAEVGSALLLVSRPSYRLRTALKSLGEIDSPDPNLGGWSIRSLPPHVGQALIAQEAACRSAARALEAQFPDEGHSWCYSREN